MHNPAHRGEILAGWITDPDLSITGFAAHIGLSRAQELPDQAGLYCATRSSG